MDLRELVYKMLVDSESHSAKSLRDDFYENPEMVTVGLSDRQRARLYTMNRPIIARASRRWRIVDGYQMEHGWPAQGADAWPDDTDPGWVDVQPIVDDCLGVEPVSALEAPDVTRGGWGDPGPHGRGFRSGSFPKATSFELELVGEGYLSTAQINIHEKGSETVYRTVRLARVLCANFQRVYLKTEPLQIDDPGLYQVFVQNHKCYADHLIPAGQLLEIT